MSNQSYRGYAKALHLCELHLLSGIALVTLLAMLLLLSFPSMGVALPAGVYTVQAQAQSAQNVGHYDVVDIRPCPFPDHVAVADVNAETVRVVESTEGLSKQSKDGVPKITLDTSVRAYNPCGTQPPSYEETSMMNHIPAIAEVSEPGPFPEENRMFAGTTIPTSSSFAVVTLNFTKSFSKLKLHSVIHADTINGPVFVGDIDLIEEARKLYFFSYTTDDEENDWTVFKNKLDQGEGVSFDNIATGHATFTAKVISSSHTDLTPITIENVSLPQTSSPALEDPFSAPLNYYYYYPLLNTFNSKTSTGPLLSGLKLQGKHQILLGGEIQSNTGNIRQASDPQPTTSSTVYTPAHMKDIFEVVEDNGDSEVPAGLYKLLLFPAAFPTNIVDTWLHVTANAPSHDEQVGYLVQGGNGYLQWGFSLFSYVPFGFGIEILPTGN